MGRKKSKNRRKKSGKRTTQPKSVSKNVQSNKIEVPKKRSAFHEIILKYGKLIPFGFIAFCIPFYVSYYPDDLVFTPKLLGQPNVFANAIQINNPNSYMIENINIQLYAETDLITDRYITLSNVSFDESYALVFIKPKRSRHINPRFIDVGNVSKIDRFNFKLTYSFDTPFIYPDVRNEVMSFSGYLNSEGEIIYLEN